MVAWSLEGGAELGRVQVRGSALGHVPPHAGAAPRVRGLVARRPSPAGQRRVASVGRPLAPGPHTVRAGTGGLALGAGTGSGLRTESVARARTEPDWGTESASLRVTAVSDLLVGEVWRKFETEPRSPERDCASRSCAVLQGLPWISRRTPSSSIPPRSRPSCACASRCPAAGLITSRRRRARSGIKPRRTSRSRRTSSRR